MRNARELVALADKKCCRMVPNVRGGQDLKASYSLMHEAGSPATPSRSHRRQPPSELSIQKSEWLPSTHTRACACTDKV